MTGDRFELPAAAPLVARLEGDRAAQGTAVRMMNTAEAIRTRAADVLNYAASLRSYTQYRDRPAAQTAMFLPAILPALGAAAAEPARTILAAAEADLAAALKLVRTMQAWAAEEVAAGRARVPNTLEPLELVGKVRHGGADRWHSVKEFDLSREPVDAGELTELVRRHGWFGYHPSGYGGSTSCAGTVGRYTHGNSCD